MKRNRLIGCGVVCVLGLGLCVGLAVALVGGLFALTKPVAESSEQFLAQIGSGKIGEAYTSAGDGLRAQQDEAAFTAAVKQIGLTDFASVTWQNRQIENQNGLAEGIVTTKAGGTKPVSVRLVRERGRWAVVGVRFGGVELTAVATPPNVPSDAELEQMIATALSDFNRAVRGRDFTAFYATLSDVWKKQTTPKELQTIFQEFIDKDIDIGAVKDMKPQMAFPSVNNKGVLVVNGHFPASTGRVGFELEYAPERGQWKLLAIGVKVGKSDTGEQ